VGARRGRGLSRTTASDDHFAAACYCEPVTALSAGRLAAGLPVAYQDNDQVNRQMSVSWVR
jgi:hypothetical protein